MAISAGSLLGFPPLLGFWGKLLLFIAGVASGHLVLVVIAGVNSAISAWYYLRLVALPLTGAASSASGSIERREFEGPRLAALACVVLLILLPLLLQPIMDESADAVLSLEELTKVQQSQVVAVYDLP